MNEKLNHAVLWLNIWRRRCCPPESILFGAMSDKLQQHLSACPWCRGDLACGPTDFAPSVRQVSASQPSPVSGHLWSLKKDLGGWGPKNRYYNPPLILLKECLDDCVSVMQVCGAVEFAAEDDIVFSGETVGFAQPWNEYTLLSDDLEYCFGQVVLPGAWASSNKISDETSFEVGSLRWFFRQLEIETGYFFASRAVDTLMDAYEDGRAESCGDTLSYLSADDFISQGRAIGLVLPENPPSDSTPEELLLSMRLPDEVLPLAAADSASGNGFALCLNMVESTLTGVEPWSIQIEQFLREGTQVHVHGRLGKVSKPSAYCLLALQIGKDLIYPVPGEYGIEGDFFWAIFEVGARKVGKKDCIIRIIERE